MQPVGIPSAAPHGNLGTPTAEAIGCRSSTETTVSTAVTTSIARVQFFIVVSSAGPTPRWPSTPSRAVATCIACPATVRISR